MQKIPKGRRKDKYRFLGMRTLMILSQQGCNVKFKIYYVLWFVNHKNENLWILTIKVLSLGLVGLHIGTLHDFDLRSFQA